MKAALFPLVFAVSAFAQSFTINTPANIAQCQPLQLTWAGGSPPYFLTVNPASQPNGPPLINLGQVNGSSFSWSKVNVQANTGIGFSLRDSNGALAQTAAVTVNDSGDSSCLGQAPSGSGGGAAPPPATSPGSSAPGATTGAPSPPASSPPAGSTSSRTGTSAGSSTSTTRSGASSATSTNAATANMVQTGAAGLIGAALVALLA